MTDFWSILRSAIGGRGLTYAEVNRIYCAHFSCDRSASVNFIALYCKSGLKLNDKIFLPGTDFHLKSTLHRLKILDTSRDGI